MTLLLPAPRIAGLLPAVCPRCIPLTDETYLGEMLVELDVPRRAG